VVARIRSLEGFESFLKPIPFARLRSAAVDGPVIVINHSEQRSDAIIVHSNTDPVLVPLPEATLPVLEELARKAHHNTSEIDFTAMLKDLWKCLVKPIVQVLSVHLQRGSRIWWCPTGITAFLPLHAAGNYSKQGQNLPNFYISSYTPTIATLLRGRIKTPPKPQHEPHLLVVGQPDAIGQAPLLSVTEEMACIFSIAPEVTIMEGSEVTPKAVLDAMEDHPLIHLSCHGHMNHRQPFLSHFSLYNEPLSVSDLVQRNLPNAELAFLSACDSAASNLETPDEALHLAASLQFAGFRSVVGTMWAMVDWDGPIVAGAFYSSLFGHKTEKAPSSAHALHRAINVLRRQKVPPSRWACFVHFGC
jgi:CHAT domain-containing protein